MSGRSNPSYSKAVRIEIRTITISTTTKYTGSSTQASGRVPMQYSLDKTQLEFPRPTTSPVSLAMDGASAEKATAIIPQAVASPLGISRYCDVSIDKEAATLWIHLKPCAPSKFTPELIEDLDSLHKSIESQVDRQRRSNPQRRSSGNCCG